MSKRILFIYNPRSGKGSIGQKLTAIIDIFNLAGYRVEIYPTKKQGDAARVAQMAGPSFEMLVCAGGDGTLNEVVSGMMERRHKIPVGYIPVGSTNDFAASLHLPQDPLKAAKAAVEGQVRRIDTGLFNERHFIYVAAFGAFTKVAYDTDQTLKNIFGHAAYILNGVASLAEIRAWPMTVRTGDRITKGRYIYGMITNSISVGGIRNITGRDIALCDGLFEVTLIREPKGLADLQATAAALIAGNTDSPMLEVFKADEIEIEAEEPLSWTLDGEYGGSPKKALIRNLHKSLKMTIPEGEELE